jgi:hypothetical protein
MADTQTYIVNEDCWLYGRFYAKGSTIDLSEKQAKYHLMDKHIGLPSIAPKEAPAKKK